MTDAFFERPILNSPYELPSRHWELDESGQPTNQVVEQRRDAKFISPIPRPKRHKKAGAQAEIIFDAESRQLSAWVSAAATTVNVESAAPSTHVVMRSILISPPQVARNIGRERAGRSDTPHYEGARQRRNANRLGIA